jgi:hypothetical protein
MPIALPHQEARHKSANRHPAERPPYRTDYPPGKTQSVQETTQDRSYRPREATNTLPQPMYGSQHARVRRAVVDQDRLRRQRKCSPNHLKGQYPRDGQPHSNSTLGMGRGTRLGARYQAEERHEEVGEGEADEEDAPAPDGAKMRREPWVDKELESDAEDTKDGHGHADFAGLEAHAASEDEGKVAGVDVRRLRGFGWVIDRGGEEHEPEGVEGSDVESKDEAGE